MTLWEERIIAAFIERYPGSAAALIEAAPGADPEEPLPKAPRPVRLKPDRIFPGMDRAPADEKESFLEAAESLEGRGLLSLIWVRHRKGETLSALVCRDPELLYELTGRDSPKVVGAPIPAAAPACAPPPPRGPAAPAAGGARV
jgi:hypothetical protein